jgi:SAM-dependent methyltransferase
MGRHARALSACGYTVTGVDRDTTAIEEARKLNGGANYVVAEIREYQPEPETFDAAIVMGQTFGHFDSTTNCEILRRLASSVRKGGRIILDLWNPEFFTAHQGESELGTPRGIVRERKRVDHGRLFVELDYPGGNHEDFEWKLFTPAQMERLAEETGLRLVIACSGFNARNLPSPLDPRTQFVLQR